MIRMIFFVRLEITEILERKTRAIPVLVGGAVVPKSSQLPNQLSSLLCTFNTPPAEDPNYAINTM